MLKKAIILLLVLVDITFFGYHMLHFAQIKTERDNAALYKWRLENAVRP